MLPLGPGSLRGVLGLRHPNRKQPRNPQKQKIEREENNEADMTTKLVLDDEPDEIGKEITCDHEGDVVDDQYHDALLRTDMFLEVSGAASGKVFRGGVSQPRCCL
jgi:hypothetical protein